MSFRVSLAGYAAALTGKAANKNKKDHPGRMVFLIDATDIVAARLRIPPILPGQIMQVGLLYADRTGLAPPA